MMPEQGQDRVFEVAIVGRATWNLHSLNNEGTIVPLKVSLGLQTTMGSE